MDNLSLELFYQLGLALAVGLLIGVERGWHERGQEEGRRVAGIRTFGLIGLLGGLWALLAENFGVLLLGVAFAAFSGLIILAHLQEARADRDVGITTVVAALITFALGALAVLDYLQVAAAGGVITATILSLKPVLHQWLQRIQPQELYAVLKLLLISVVLLPILPNQGYGPWQALNPYEMWWMVVLIAAISFVGYVAMKTTGARSGIMLTSLFGGMVSSTAVTLTLSRMARNDVLPWVLAAGVVVAAATMFPRILLEVAVINPDLLWPLLAPMLAMMVVAYGSGLWFWRRRKPLGKGGELPLRNPFELKPAIQFGLLLMLVMLLGEALRAWLGDAGIYLLALVSGIADVDAITLSLARMALDDLSPVVAVQGIVLAAMTNTLVKGFLVVAIANRRVALRVMPAFLATIAAGGAALWLSQ